MHRHSRLSRLSPLGRLDSQGLLGHLRVVGIRPLAVTYLLSRRHHQPLQAQ